MAYCSQAIKGVTVMQVKVLIHGLPEDHRQGQFNRCTGELVHTCANGQKMVKFPNGSQWAFDAQYVIIQTQRQILGNGVEIIYQQGGQVKGTVKVQGQTVGNFQIDRDWTVTTGRQNQVASSVRSVVIYFLSQYRKDQASLETARKAFGCP